MNVIVVKIGLDVRQLVHQTKHSTVDTITAKGDSPDLANLEMSIVSWIGFDTFSPKESTSIWLLFKWNQVNRLTPGLRINHPDCIPKIIYADTQDAVRVLNLGTEFALRASLLEGLVKQDQQARKHFAQYVGVHFAQTLEWKIRVQDSTNTLPENNLVYDLFVQPTSKRGFSFEVSMQRKVLEQFVEIDTP